MSIKVSVVVSTYGRLEHITKLVDSCRSAFPADRYEVLAVSSDDPLGPKGQWLRAQPDVTVLQADIRTNHRQRSLYAYENMGIKAAVGDWVFVTNDDTDFNALFYSSLLPIADRYDVILVNGHVGEVGLGPRIPSIGTITAPGQAPLPLYLYDFSIIRKSVYQKIGFLDERLDWFGKGFDLAMACETAPGLRIARSSDLQVNHAISPENRTPPHYGPDFTYATNKWSAWCAANGWSYSWPW